MIVKFTSVAATTYKRHTIIVGSAIAADSRPLYPHGPHPARGRAFRRMNPDNRRYLVRAIVRQNNGNPAILREVSAEIDAPRPGIAIRIFERENALRIALVGGERATLSAALVGVAGAR